jgi:branched-chain amino acid transport system substrate-binding protein
MKSRLSAAVAIGAMFLVAPASAQVKIGILNDQSRVYADAGGKDSLEVARMVVEDFGGEVLSQKIEIFTADHQNKPDLATAIARRWYDTEGVDMITELTTSSVALAVQELSNEKKKIDIVRGCRDLAHHWRRLHALQLPLGL